jgi:translation initiation factor 2B subunit (eIF-2B alpha/beta/delta family)
LQNILNNEGISFAPSSTLQSGGRTSRAQLEQRMETLRQELVTSQAQASKFIPSNASAQVFVQVMAQSLDALQSLGLDDDEHQQILTSAFNDVFEKIKIQFQKYDMEDTFASIIKRVTGSNSNS